MKTQKKITVRYAETDKMGIVHHSNYAVWFECARTEFFKNLGYTYSSIEDDGILLPLTDLKCSFKKPAKYEDEIILILEVVKLTCVRLSFCYEVYDNCFNLIASGETSHAWTDKDLKPLNIEKHKPALYNMLKQTI